MFCYSLFMRILVLSDSHGNYPLALTACENARPFDAIIHLGDSEGDTDMIAYVEDAPLIQVAGNCDLGTTAPRELLWECEGKRVLLVHGDAYGVKGGLSRLEQRGLELQVDAIFFGHSHQAVITTLSGMLVVNPGTLMRRATHCSYALLEITPQGISASLHDIS